MVNIQMRSIVWSAIERFSGQGIQFILSIIIARLVSPSDYGLIAMLTIFLSVAQSLIDSGFSNALIQKKDRTETDYATVFYFNLVVSMGIYGIFWLVSPYIASFYNEPILKDVARLVGLNFILSAFSIIQRTKLIINLDFKTQAKISIISITISGFIGIYCAWKGLGVWALVFQSLINNTINTILLWLFSHWKPIFVFSISSFKRLFSFGSRMLLTGLLATFYNNMYSLVIGKFFTAQDLGYYNRMHSLAVFPSSNITSIIARAVYPIQCNIQDNNQILKESFFKLLRLSSFVIFPAMLGLAALSKPIILVLLSDKWVSASGLLTILCFALMWNHIMYLNWQILGVKGRSDLSFKSEVYKKIISVTILICTIPLGIRIMCIGMVVYSMIDILIIICFLKQVFPISHSEEYRIIFPLFLLSFAMFCIVSFCTSLITNPYMQIVIGLGLGICSYAGLAYFFKFPELYYYLHKLRRNNV